LSEPLTISVLPYSPYAKETAEIAHAKGLEILLHLPLESLNGQDFAMHADGMIRASMSPEEVEKLMENNLNQIPFIRGVNNHMGSKVTADASMMRLILAPLKSRNLFFLDSRTTGRSVAYSVALEMGIPAAVRQVFLDADGDKVTIRDRLLELFRLAQRNGKAVGICHPFMETVQVLKDSLRLAEDFNVDVVPASRMARR
ncbi:MAG TPA: divergent polysaccharide deacetylase family protein, partial [Candidatus Aminicenantes bacterium]|nr:divergent polysaccharide deacetylase family protein [Candidatus Aminicenantes bacterium]